MKRINANSYRIPFTLTFHPALTTKQLNPSLLKTLKYSKRLETGTIFSHSPLISFQRDKNIGKFLVRSSFQTSDQPGTFKCARSRRKTCPLFSNVEKMSELKRSINITDHFTSTSANVIYCITCTYCKKLYIRGTGRRLGDRFREHLRDVERNDRHFNLPNNSKQHMAVCGLYLHLCSSESRTLNHLSNGDSTVSEVYYKV